MLTVDVPVRFFFFLMDLVYPGGYVALMELFALKLVSQTWALIADCYTCTRNSFVISIICLLGVKLMLQTCLTFFPWAVQ